MYGIDKPDDMTTKKAEENKMEIKSFELLTKQEIKEKYTKEKTRFDIALKEHMDKIDKAEKALKAEIDAVKAIAKDVFGKDGGNGVFSTETRISYILNENELIEIIGKEKYDSLKNRLSEKTYVHW